jgi:hypothetical protein
MYIYVMTYGSIRPISQLVSHLAHRSFFFRSIVWLRSSDWIVPVYQLAYCHSEHWYSFVSVTLLTGIFIVGSHSTTMSSTDQRVVWILLNSLICVINLEVILRPSRIIWTDYPFITLIFNIFKELKIDIFCVYRF